MAKTKIKYVDFTWNPVWGCNNDCDYCYARRIAKRFAEPMIRKENEYNNIDLERAEIFFDDKIETVSNFKPFLFNHQLYKTLPKKPTRIFIGSMSDIVFWKDEWINKIVKQIKCYPQHIFLLLTKFPKVYKKLDKIMPYNVIFGVTITKTNELNKIIIMVESINNPIKRKFFTSFEPLLEYIPIKNVFGGIGLMDWVIIGAMSGKNKQHTKIKWIDAIVDAAEEYKLPVFVKQIEINGKIEKDINKFPKNLQKQEFPF